MAKKIGDRTIVVIREVERDPLDLPATGPAPRHEVDGCEILPRSSHEEGKGWVIVEGRMVIAPYDADVLATDEVEVDGEVWAVDGAVGRYQRKGKEKASIFYLERRGTR